MIALTKNCNCILRNIINTEFRSLSNVAYQNSYNNIEFRWRKFPRNYNFLLKTQINSNMLINSQPTFFNSLTRNMSSDMKSENIEKKTALSTKDKLKKAVKEYGSTVIVFHITISLISLGCFYLLVSSGVDVISILNWMGINTSKFVAGTSTFVLAYAIHKVFAPVRISITLGATPIIVRYLRNKNFIK